MNYMRDLGLGGYDQQHKRYIHRESFANADHEERCSLCGTLLTLMEFSGPCEQPISCPFVRLYAYPHILPL